MKRKEQQDNGIIIAALGDSQTDFRSFYGVPAGMMWLGQLRDRLNIPGKRIQVRGYGVGGNTTTQMLARADAMFLYTKPDIAIIYGGVNDPGSGISTATTQANTQALCKAMKYGAKGSVVGGGVSVSNQINLPANGKIGDKYVVMSDTSTNGGLIAIHSMQHATITGSIDGAQSVWEYRTPQAGELGWGRVALSNTPAFSEGISKVMVVSTNYLNWPSGGDNYNINTGTGIQYPSYVGVRQAAKAATVAEGVVYCDQYAFGSMQIYGGSFLGNEVPVQTTQGSGATHYAPSNQHLNIFGHYSASLAVEYQIKHENWI